MTITAGRALILSFSMALGFGVVPVALRAQGTGPALAASAAVAGETLSAGVASRLRARLENPETPGQLVIGGEPMWASAALPAFYERRGYGAAWVGDDGPLAPVDELLGAIREADQEGLNPSDYHLGHIRQVLGEVRRNQGRRVPLNAGRLTDLDLLLTDAFLVYGSHLLQGRVNPETVHSEWKANRRGADLAEVLEQALAGGGVRATLDGLLPPQPGYARLREALARYRQIAAAGGWLAVAEGPPLRLNDQDARVPTLRRRLAVTADVAPDPPADSLLVDSSLEAGIRRFQARHGLAASGVVDSATITALNVPVEDRVSQIRLNLERWRWLPQDLGPRYLVVNIAAYSLRVIDEGQEVLAMRVMVGRPYRRTPVFSDTIRYLVLSPYWNVPHHIAVQDKLPLIKRDPDYLARQRMHLLQGWGAETREVDPATVDWSRITAQDFPYRIRQDPGPLNALGRVKFMFPNPYNVYLHDTPSQELFDRPDRDFSSGCIRVERPMELAEYLLSGSRTWTRRTIQAAVARGMEQIVSLPHPMPVHIEYWTSWVDDDGTIHFRRDLYGRDQQLAEALRSAAPTVPS